MNEIKQSSKLVTFTYETEEEKKLIMQSWEIIKSMGAELTEVVEDE